MLIEKIYKIDIFSNKINNSTIKPNIDMTFLMSIKHEKSTLKKERIKNFNTRYYHKHKPNNINANK